MQPGQESTEEPFEFTITREQLAELVDLAGKFYREAEHCREAGRWPAALILLGGSIEAALLATACLFEPQLRESGLWKPKSDPTKWTLGQLGDTARQAGWLPEQKPGTKNNTDIFATLGGDAGGAMKFVERLRNMIVHPGAYLREPLRPDIDNEEHMRQTYELIDRILAVVYERLNTQMETLP